MKKEHTWTQEQTKVKEVKEPTSELPMKKKMRNGKIVYIKAVIVNKELFDFEKLSIKERVNIVSTFHNQQAL